MQNKSNDGSVDSEHYRSLDKFFYENKTLDLDTCSQEPIHYIGSVQATTALLVFNFDSQALDAYSENLPSLLNTSKIDKSLSLDALLPEIAAEISTLSILPDEEHTLLIETLQTHQGVLKVVFYKYANQGYLEFFPDPHFSVEEFRQQIHHSRYFASSIMAAKTKQEALDITAIAVRKLSDFARVKIYEFQEDWSGKVIAEDKNEDMPSFLGLHFPETDIPKQARYLMNLIPYRGIGSVDGNDAKIISVREQTDDNIIDLSFSLIRSVSPIHLEYLKNMGVEATATFSIINNGQLWGIIACHNTQPGLLSFDLWEALKTLASTFSSKLDQLRAEESTEMMTKLRKIEEHVAVVIREKGNIESSLTNVMPELRTFLNGDGFAFQYGANLYTDGIVPPDDFILDLINWANANVDENSAFNTNALQQIWPASKPYKNSACGVLIEPINIHRVCHLVWFRQPVAQTVKWAGKPTKVESQNEQGQVRLSPRLSFETWIEEHQNNCINWRDSEINGAREILKNVLDIVASQMQLTQTNKNMEIFSFAAAHDLNAPLRHIRLALEMLNEDQALPDGSEQKELLDQVSLSSDRLKSILDGMTRILEVETNQLVPQKTSLNEVFDVVKYTLQREINDQSVLLTIADSPDVLGDKDLLVLLFTNLIGNAIKYHSPERSPCINVDVKERGNLLIIDLSDNGVGIPRDKAEVIFEPFQRLQSHNKIQGTGLGLSICKRIVESLGGNLVLDSSYSPGAKFVITLKR